jgi:CTP synthase
MKYEGECVEFVRHIPEEINLRLKTLAESTKAEVVIMEIGGTVGDIQNMLFLEAIRQLRLKQRGDVMVVHVAYLPLPKNLGELKTKPAQQSVSLLLASGVQPDIIVTRSEKEIDSLRKEKISIFCNVQKEDIFSNPDLKSVYQVPGYLKKQGIVENIVTKLGLAKAKPDEAKTIKWETFVQSTTTTTKKVKIGIVGKYFESGEYSLEDSYLCVMEAFKQAFYRNNLVPDIKWIGAERMTAKNVDELKEFDGLVVPQGWGSRGVEGKIETIRFARENKVPYLGLCFGMQMAAIEFARNVLGMKGANSTEVDPQTAYPIIHIMPHQIEYLKNKQYGGTIRLGAWPAKVKEGTKLWHAYEKYTNSQFTLPIVAERHRHRYEFNSEYLERFEKAGFIASATSEDGKLVEAMELVDHPFFVGVQYHPEFKARPMSPHPLFLAFMEAAIKNRG